MTNEEARNILKRKQNYDISYVRKTRLKDIIPVIDAVDLALEALEYRIPKKPERYLHSVPHYRCPTCNSLVKLYENFEIFSFCIYCGQIIDWSEVENEIENN